MACIIETLAASIAAGDREEPPAQTSLAGSLAGKIIGRLFARQLRHLADDAVMTSPVLSRLHPHPPGLGLHVPEPGQSPAAAEVITDPDIAERMPWLLELPPGMASSASGTASFAAWLEESEGTVVVRHSPGRIGALSPEDAEAYLPYIRTAQAHGEVVAAMADHRVTTRGSLRVTIRLGLSATSDRLLAAGSPQGFAEMFHGVTVRYGLTRYRSRQRWSIGAVTTIMNGPAGHAHRHHQ